MIAALDRHRAVKKAPDPAPGPEALVVPWFVLRAMRVNAGHGSLAVMLKQRLPLTRQIAWAMYVHLKNAHDARFLVIATP